MDEENTNTVIDLLAKYNPIDLLTKYNPINYLTQTSIDTLLNRYKPSEASNLAGLPITDVPLNPIDNIGRGIASIPYAGTQAVTNMLVEQPKISYPLDAASIYQGEYRQPIDTAALVATQKEYPDLVNWFTDKQPISPSQYPAITDAQATPTAVERQSSSYPFDAARIYEAEYGQPINTAALADIQKEYPDLVNWFTGKQPIPPSQYKQDVEQPTPEQQSMSSPQASVTSEQPANVDKWTQAADTLLNSILNPQQQQQDPVVQSAIQLITDRLSSPAQTSEYEQKMQERTLAALQNADLRTQELEAQRSMNPLDYLSWGLGNVVSPIVGRPTTTREAFMDRKYAPQQQDIDQDYARAIGQAQTLGQVAGDENKNISDQIRGLSDLLQLRNAAAAQAQQQPAAQLRNLMLAKDLLDLPARQQLTKQMNELNKQLLQQQVRAFELGNDKLENPPPVQEDIISELIRRRIAEAYGLNPDDAKAAETMKLD